VGDEPSTLLPESHFRDTADRALQRLSRTNVEDRGAIVAWAGRVVEYLLELRKFRMAEGVELVPADRKNLNAAIDMLASCSESLPADIARLVDEKDP